MTIALSDLKSVVRLPGNWDLDYLRKFSTVEGMTFDAVVSELGGALLAFNRSLTAGYWARYIRATTDIEAEYAIGNAAGKWKKVTDLSRPDPVRGDTTGHMLPMDDYGKSLQWTNLALRRMRRAKLEATIRALTDGAQDTWEYALLKRMFYSLYDAVGTGRSVPFADAGVADSSYVPPKYDGVSFASTHTHYLCHADDAAGRTAFLKAAAAHLKEHGILSPWDLVVSATDKAVWSAQTEFVKPERAAILAAGVAARAVVDEEEYIGVLETDEGYFNVKLTSHVPTKYAGAFKPRGFGAAGNVLAVRYEEGYPLGVVIQGNMGEFPLEGASTLFTFGVGVDDRVSGVCVFFDAGGVWSNPTIT